MMARVRAVMACATPLGSMQKSSSAGSTRTGVAPHAEIARAVAMNVLDAVMTSSPGSDLVRAQDELECREP